MPKGICEKGGEIIGEGVGIVAGAKAGGAIGGPVGGAIGAKYGGEYGGKAGGYVGKKVGQGIEVVNRGLEAEGKRIKQDYNDHREYLKRTNPSMPDWEANHKATRFAMDRSPFGDSDYP